MNRRKIAIAIACSAILLRACIVLYPRLWVIRPNAELTVNGAASESSSVYVSTNGRILIALDRPDRPVECVVYPDRQVVGNPNPYMFFCGPGFAVTRDEPLRTVSLTSSKIDADTQDTHVVWAGEYVEFTSLEGNRIRLRVAGL